MLARQKYLASLVLAFLAACGGESGPPDDNQNPPPGGGTTAGDAVTEQIGPGGGTIVTSDGGMTLTFPAGALATGTDITVQPMVNTAPGGIGLSYRIQPAGLVLSQPVSVSLAVDSAALGDASIEEVGIATRDTAGNWYAHVGGGSNVPATLAASTKRTTIGRVARTMTPGSLVLNELRFSDAGVLEVTVVTFWRVEPRPRRKIATGQSIQLQVMACFLETQSVVSGEGELSPLPHRPTRTCAPSVRQGTWSVVSLSGQTASADVGTVRAGTPTSSGTYTAPLRHVPGGAVDVIVNLYSAELQRTYPLHILVEVEQSSAWTGVVEWTMSGTDVKHIHNDNPMLPYFDQTTTITREGTGRVELMAIPGRVNPTVVTLDPAGLVAADYMKRVVVTITRAGDCQSTLTETTEARGNYSDTPTNPPWGGIGEVTLLFGEANEYRLAFVSVQWEGTATETRQSSTECEGDEDDLPGLPTSYETTYNFGPEMAGGFNLEDGMYHGQVNPAHPNLIEGSAPWKDGIHGWATTRVTWSITRP